MERGTVDLFLRDFPRSLERIWSMAQLSRPLKSQSSIRADLNVRLGPLIIVELIYDLSGTTKRPL